MSVWWARETHRQRETHKEAERQKNEEREHNNLHSSELNQSRPLPSPPSAIVKSEKWKQESARGRAIMIINATVDKYVRHQLTRGFLAFKLWDKRLVQNSSRKDSTPTPRTLMATLTAMSRYVTTTAGLGGYDMSSLPEGAVDYFNPAVIEQLLLRPLPPVRPLATATPCML